MKRREFIKSTSGLALILPFNSSFNKLFDPKSEMKDYETFTCKIGKYTCKIYKDLMFKYQGKDYFINAAEDEVKKELNRYKQTTENISSPFIAMLLEHENEKILIDTGIGYSKNPLIFRGNTYQFKGKLMEKLDIENVDKNQITQVILTHLHPDHIGGIYDENDLINFPKAKFFIHEEEWNFWFSSKSNDQPPLFKYFIENNVSGLKDKNIELIKGEDTESYLGSTPFRQPGIPLAKLL